MNSDFIKIKEDSVVFIHPIFLPAYEDIREDEETLRVYGHKIRDKETGELPSEEDIIKDYEKNAGKKMTFNRVYSVAIGIFSEGKIQIQYISGTEEENLQYLFPFISQYNYLGGFGLLSFGLPMIINNGWRYTNVLSHVPDRFITSGKKPWNLNNIIDLMDVFKGTHFVNSSLSDIAYHFRIKDERTVDSEDLYLLWKEGKTGEIRDYAIASMSLMMRVFLSMKHKNNDVEEVFVMSPEAPLEEERNVIKDIINTNTIPEDVKDKLGKDAEEGIPEEDQERLEEILTSAYVKTDFINMDSDNKATRLDKEQEVKDIFKVSETTSIF